jgi:hypothetical protein
MALSDVTRHLLRTQLTAAVRVAYREFGDHAALVTRTNPLATPEQVLDRDDVQQSLAAAIRDSEDTARQLVRRAWSRADGPEGSAVLARLLADVHDAYSAVPEHLRAAVLAAYQSVPPRAFRPGVSPPGSQPLTESAAERAHAIQAAVREQADRMLVRSRASVDVSFSFGQSAAVLEEAQLRTARGEHVRLKWHAHLDTRTCPWCRQLDGMVVAPGEEFPHGSPVIGASGHLRHPPKVWLGVLHGSPRHPYCRCWIELIVLSPGEAVPAIASPAAPEPQPFIRASGIARLSEAQYRGLYHFLSAATHQLDAQLKRLQSL